MIQEWILIELYCFVWVLVNIIIPSFDMYWICLPLEHFNTIVLLFCIATACRLLQSCTNSKPNLQSAHGEIFNKYSTSIWIVWNSIDNLCFNSQCWQCIVECLWLLGKAICKSLTAWLLCHLLLDTQSPLSGIALILCLFMCYGIGFVWREILICCMFGHLYLPKVLLYAAYWCIVSAIPVPAFSSALTECTVLMTLRFHYGGQYVNWYGRNVIQYLNEPQILIPLSCVTHCAAIQYRHSKICLNPMLYTMNCIIHSMTQSNCWTVWPIIWHLSLQLQISRFRFLPVSIVLILLVQLIETYRRNRYLRMCVCCDGWILRSGRCRNDCECMVNMYLI